MDITPALKLTHEIAWAAGMFEGEGCTSRSNGKAIRLTISGSDYDIISRLPIILTVGKIYGPYQQRPTSKPMYSYAINKREDIEMVMKLFWPYLGERRRTKWLELTK